MPIWVLLLSHAAMGLGTLFGGWRIVKTMGMRIAKLQPFGGVCAETSGAVTLATWEIETDMSWEAYSRWIAPRLADFQQRASPDGTLRFARILEGDSYSVVFKRKGHESETLAIHAVFEASPF